MRRSVERHSGGVRGLGGKRIYVPARRRGWSSRSWSSRTPRGGPSCGFDDKGPATVGHPAVLARQPRCNGCTMQTSIQQDDPIVNPAPADEGWWKVLYRTGAAAVLISAVFIAIQVAVFLVWPPPIRGTVADWFTLLHDHRLAGLVDLDLLLVADNVLLIPILLALYVALRRAYPSVVLIAAALGLVGVPMYLASNPAVQMAALSDQYAAATTDVERTTAVAAGKAMLAMWQGTAFHTAYILGSVAGVLFGVVMLRSRAFSRPTGVAGDSGQRGGTGLVRPSRRRIHRGRLRAGPRGLVRADRTTAAPIRSRDHRRNPIIDEPSGLMGSHRRHRQPRGRVGAVNHQFLQP